MTSLRTNGDISSTAISDYREDFGVSQQELADILNTSLYAIVRWEQGDIEPSQDALDRLKALSSLDKKSISGYLKSPKEINFAATGVRSKKTHLPETDVKIDFLSKPRDSIIDDIFSDQLWGESSIFLGEILETHQKTATTLTEPFNEEISAGKNTYTYDAHTYHTKVPPQGIAKVISKYLPEGGIVLDPFAGSGMTGVAARYIGCDVVLNELSPAASFIAHNFIRTIDVELFNSAVSYILKELEETRKNLYTTQCRECKKDVESIYTVWSYELECNHCNSPFILWDHSRKYGSNVKEHKLLRKFPCPTCNEEVNKSYLKRCSFIPVFIGYKCCSKKIKEHPLNKRDFETIKSAEKILLEYADSFPKTELPDGVNLNQPKRHGITSVDKFYTPRNLAACASIWKSIKRIEDSELSAAVGFAFTSLYQRVTRMSEYRFWGGSGNTANFNVPHISNESNVFITFSRKAKSISDHFMTTAKAYRGKSVLRTGSATNLNFLPDASIDFIFTDPPFGANINYSEMNILWESWLNEFTESASEAIVSKPQNKDLLAYKNLMSDSLKEAYRVLRPGHWMVLVFMNSSEKVWGALNEAIDSAGFSVEKINVFDKQHGTFKQYVSENTAGADLMLHCRKPYNGKMPVKKETKGYISIAEFMTEQQRLPVLPYLHVKRKSEIDFRTLYSRYISASMHRNSPVIDFSEFRIECSKILESVE